MAKMFKTVPLGSSRHKFDPVGEKIEEKRVTLREENAAVYLIPYHHTTGLIMRSAGRAKLIGYCKESPLRVLECAFPHFHVTRVGGYNLFDSSDFEKTTPMLGLGIMNADVPINYGIRIYGNVEGLLKLDYAFSVKRNKNISIRDKKRILGNLRKICKDDMGFVLGRVELERIKTDTEDICRTIISAKYK